MPLRILTINLYNGRARPESLAAALTDLSPDIVAAQELSPNASDVLAEWASHHLLDPRDDTFGMGIAATTPVTLTRLDFPNRNPVVARFDGSPWGFLGPIEMINAHLVNPLTRPILLSKRLRVRELTELEQLFKAPSRPVQVLVGDLNSSPAWPVYRRLAKLATDAAIQAGTAKRSWGPTSRSPRLLRIDHAFIHGAHAKATRLVDIAGADHRGLLVELEPIR